MGNIEKYEQVKNDNEGSQVMNMIEVLTMD